MFFWESVCNLLKAINTSSNNIKYEMSEGDYVTLLICMDCFVCSMF